MLSSRQGYYKHVTKAGVGSATPSKGTQCLVQYAGRLVDGTPFDANKNFKFPVGIGRVIRGAIPADSCPHPVAVLQRSSSASPSSP